VGANSTMLIQAGRVKQSKKAALEEQGFKIVQNFLKLKDKKGTSSLAALRSAGKDLDLRVISPNSTKLRELEPTFLWSISDPSTEFMLTLYNDAGIVWKQKVRNVTQCVYPTDAPPIESGMTYSWTLETTDPLRFPPLRSQAAFFEVLSEDEEKEIQQALGKISKDEMPSESAYHLLRASLFFDHSLMEDAITETRKALETAPGNTALHSILARLYAEVGCTDEALEEYNRLLDKRQ